MHKDSKCYVENSFSYPPEMNIDIEDKTEEATANLWVRGKFSGTDRAHEQTIALDLFSLPHKNWRVRFLANACDI